MAPQFQTENLGLIRGPNFSRFFWREVGNRCRLQLRPLRLFGILFDLRRYRLHRTTHELRHPLAMGREMIMIW